MATTSEFLGALVFLVAGSYQWTASKDVCLAQCQTPFAFPDASWRLSARCTGFHDPWPSPRRALRRLLLGADGAVVRGGSDEPTLGRPPRIIYSRGEDHVILRSSDGAHCWHTPHDGRYMAIHPSGRPALRAGWPKDDWCKPSDEPSVNHALLTDGPCRSKFSFRQG
jgi:hypothetical protein